MQQANSFSVLVRVLAAAPRTRNAIGFAGIVEAVGSDVTAFRPGDAVYGEAQSVFGEYVCVAEHNVAIKPESLEFEAAAAGRPDYTPGTPEKMHLSGDATPPASGQL